MSHCVGHFLIGLHGTYSTLWRSRMGTRTDSRVRFRKRNIKPPQALIGNGNETGTGDEAGIYPIVSYR